MAIASNKFRLLFLTATKSDIEYQITVLNQKRMNLLFSAESISGNLASAIYSSGEHSDFYDGNSGIFPWMTGGSAAVEDYEAELEAIQIQDSAFEIKVKKMESIYEAKKTEIDSVKEILKKNTEKDYKTFG